LDYAAEILPDHLRSLGGCAVGFIVPDRTLAVSSFFVAGLGFANIFPLVFAIAVKAMPEHTNELSGLMATAILGGACLPPLMLGGRSQLRATQLPGAAGGNSIHYLDRPLQPRGSRESVNTWNSIFTTVALS
jgi:hypothetical protein